MTEQQAEAVTDETEEELDDQEQLDGEAGAEQEWTPPTREEWEEQQKQLAAAQAKTKRANEQARKLREAKQAAAAASSGGDSAATTAEDVAKWQARAVRAAAKVQLVARGADADMVDLALARLKPTEVEFDSDDEPDLVDWLDDMEERYPKLFKQPEAASAPGPQRPKAGRVETPTGKPVRAKPTLGEQILANSLGATGRRRG